MLCETPNKYTMISQKIFSTLNTYYGTFEDKNIYNNKHVIKESKLLNGQQERHSLPLIHIYMTHPLYGGKTAISSMGSDLELDL